MDTTEVVAKLRKGVTRGKTEGTEVSEKTDFLHPWE
jgi:hypothetical protein